MKRLLGRLGRALSSARAEFRDDQSGNVAIIVALTLVIMMLMLGAAIDLGRWLHARDQTVSAVDAAVLAGARTYHTTNKDAAAGISAAQQFYKENVTKRLKVVDDTVTFGVNGDGKGISASGNAYIKTPFLQFAGIGRLPLFSASQAVAEFGSGEAEVSIMLDVTGSMAGSKLQDLKDAAKNLVEIVLNANPQTKIAIVPFSEDIRLPTNSARDKARGTGLPACKRVSNSGSVTNTCNTANNTTMYYLSDCVVERTGGSKYNDDAPGTGKYVLGHYTSNSTGSGTNRKGVCVVPSGAAVQPLTTNKSTLTSKIDGLGAAGGTAGHLGTAWAWYTLSPNWNSLWSSDNQARPYNNDKESREYVRKIAVLMTDGEYNTQYNSNGIATGQNSWGNSCQGAANGCSSEQAKQLCKNMKEQGKIEVFAVVFGNDQGAIDVMKQCASPDTEDVVYFYKATNGEQLKLAFQDIGIKLTQLHLSQ
jgi:Flp pilus assembly protein TadG